MSAPANARTALAPLAAEQMTLDLVIDQCAEESRIKIALLETSRGKLEGLKIYKARGHWYVYPRGGGDPLIKGCDGSREDALKKLAEPEFMQTYNRPQLQKRLAASFPIETLGGFIHWYSNGDIDRPPKERKDSPSKVEGCYP
jgi:hypothetical protein